MICTGLFLVSKYINGENKERLAIINNTKENVIKYKECEKIEEYYYCWKDKEEE